jgi:hypothetical protein
MLAYRYLKGQWVFLEGNGHDQYRRRVASVKLQGNLNYEDIVRRNGLDKNNNSTYRYFHPEHSYSAKKGVNARMKYLPQSSPARMVWVDGYVRENGTFVQGHWKRQSSVRKNELNQTHSHRTLSNTFVKSYNVRTPSLLTPSSSSGGTVNVKGYYRKDSTYVKPYIRSYPKKKG